MLIRVYVYIYIYIYMYTEYVFVYGKYRIASLLLRIGIQSPPAVCVPYGCKGGYKGHVYHLFSPPDIRVSALWAFGFQTWVPRFRLPKALRRLGFRV